MLLLSYNVDQGLNRRQITNTVADHKISNYRVAVRESSFSEKLSVSCVTNIKYVNFYETLGPKDRQRLKTAVKCIVIVRNFMCFLANRHTLLYLIVPIQYPFVCVINPLCKVKDI